MAEMVDVGGKEIVSRSATASGVIRLRQETLAVIAAGKVEKGDVLQAATLAAIQGAKRAWELIPLCHPLRLDSVRPEVSLGEEEIVLRCTVTAMERTGVEMEALMAVTLGLLTVWDMVKALEKDSAGQYPTTRIVEVKVEEKRVEHGG
ncbi:MAG: cyclic pyranopterin monophosphate synthase MoaC [Candidatus Thermoplasmatota archaeon]|nr:cyclic pyranopterin monophosphate synthase MoaC [Candidatus Thermoplasmatota archaeon]